MQAYKEEDVVRSQPFPAEIFVRDSRQERIVAPLHWHDCLELLYMLEGRAEQRINDTIVTLEPDSLIVLREGDLHETRTAPDEAVRILVVKFHPELLADTYARGVESAYVRELLSQENPRVLHTSDEDADAVSIRSLLGQLLTEWTQRRPVYELAVHGLLYCLVAALTRIGAFSSVLAALPEPEQKRWSDLIEAIIAGLPDVMTAREAAQRLNYSYSHFSRRFARVTGRTFKSYVDFLRIREAERLALQEGLPLSVCASRTGFSDPAVFSRTYRRIRGQAARSLLKDPAATREHIHQKVQSP